MSQSKNTAAGSALQRARAALSQGPRTNESLQSIYENVYAEGKEGFFSTATLDVTAEVLKTNPSWAGKTVLEIGCGTGETAAALAAAGAVVLATDFASPAIATAQERHKHANLTFRACQVEEITGTFDVILLQDVFEHVDNPVATLKTLHAFSKPGGQMIFTCPAFLNPRGYVWMTLQLLFDVPMSLSDIHFISPFDMERWLKESGLDSAYSIKWHSFRHGLACGKDMVVDMRKRLTNALRDAKLDNSKVDALLTWLEQAGSLEKEAHHNGSKILYHFRPKSGAV